MLSDRALHILKILEQQNGKAITAKKLAVLSGISERSVKTYINEVAEFCEETGSTLLRKPGLGFVYEGNEQTKAQLCSEHKKHEEHDSKSYRMSYIVYVLLMGWSTYTITLFSEELGVSKNSVSEDLNELESRLEAFGLHLSRVAGKGISLEGDEFTKRKAFHHFCIHAVEDCEKIEQEDLRLTQEDCQRFLANYGKASVLMATKIIKQAEEKNHVWYTDFSYKMIVEYFSIQLMRIRQHNMIEKSIWRKDGFTINVEHSLKDTVLDILFEEYDIVLTDPEIEYLKLILMSGEFQNYILEDGEEYCIWDSKKIHLICHEIGAYISEVFHVEIFQEEVFEKNLLHFLPASFIRARYGFEVVNPFFQDVKRMYPGIFTVTFAFERYYKLYAETVSNEQELSFLALFIGGAVVRGRKHINIVLLSSSGDYITRIISKRLEEQMPGIKIIATITKRELKQLEQLQYDLVLTVLPDQLEERVDAIAISPVVSEDDVRHINDAYFDQITAIAETRFCKLRILAPESNLLFEEERMTRSQLLEKVCEQMNKMGYVEKDYVNEILAREKICSTNLGNGVAIPHCNSQLVLKSGVFMVALKHPVIWGESEVSLVCVLALNFDNISFIREFFSEFTQFLEDRTKHHMPGPYESLEQLKKEVHAILHEK